ncbi:MAG: D-aminopeptidase DppA [Vampirovibrio sp.]|nr:D-aminopeptidase DppA [Vampirovibrio sp.]
MVSPHHCSTEPDRSAYDWAVSQLEMEVAAVVEAALDHGVSEVLVNDSHCTMTNLYLEQVDPRVSLLTGKPKRCAMSAGLDETFDAAIYVGYHAKAGAHQGVLSHTFHNKLFDVSVNGVSYGEGGINALYASLVFGVPLVLASGDRAFVEEIHQLLPNLETVETKVGLTQTAARCHPLELVLQDYGAKTRKVLENRANWQQNVLSLPGPYELKMTFINPLAADAANTIPGLERADGRTLIFRTDHFQTVYQMLQSCYSILALTNYLE